MGSACEQALTSRRSEVSNGASRQVASFTENASARRVSPTQHRLLPVRLYTVGAMSRSSTRKIVIYIWNSQ